MEDIVIIEHEPLTKRTQNIFCIKEILSAGFNVEYWDMSQYFFPGISLADEVKVDYSFNVPSLEVLKEKLQHKIIDNTVFIIEVFNIWENRNFFKLLKKYKCFSIKLQLYATGSIPMNRIKNFFHEDFKGKFRKINNFLKNKLYSLYRKIYHLNCYDVEISSNPLNNYKQKVFINHPDYEQAKIDFHKPRLINYKYAVFLDEYFPLHPDINFFFKLKINDNDVCNYLKLMCNFFDRVEKQFDIKVVVAAHPKSNYTEADFGNRSVMKYVTGQLVQHAEFAIVHSSTSISYAVIFNRPLLVCFSNEYKECKVLYEFGYRQGKLLNAQIIQIELCSNTIIPTPIIDNNAYQEYKYTYLTRPEIEKLKNKDIIIQYLKNL